MKHLDTPIAQLSKRLDSSSDVDKTNQLLISELLEYFHPIYSEQLNELVRLAERVESVHGDSPDCPNGLTTHLVQITRLLEAYLQKEQNSLFPALLNKQSSQANEIIESIKQEQNELTLSIKNIDNLTNGIITPKDACNTWRKLYLNLNTFKAYLLQQFQLENNILFCRNLSSNDTVDFTPSNQTPKKEEVHGEDFCCGSCGGS